MAILYEYLWALGQNWWWFMTSGPYLLESVLKAVWSGYDAWANKYVKPRNRRRALTWLAFFGVFFAGFLAFRDEHTKLQEAQAQLQQFQSQLQQAQSQFAASQSMFLGQQSHQSNIISQLSKFHAEALELSSAEVTINQYPLWKQKQEEFATKVTTWVEKNLGAEAKTHLLNTSVFTNTDYAFISNPDQRERVIWLDKIAHNIRDLGSGLNQHQKAITAASATAEA